MHAAEAAAAPASAPTAAPAAPETFWQLFSKCSDPSSSDPSSLFRIQCLAAQELWQEGRFVFRRIEDHNIAALVQSTHFQFSSFPSQLISKSAG